MNYLSQLKTVTLWEFQRFYKPRNELMGIVIMLAVSIGTFFITRYAMREKTDDTQLYIAAGIDNELKSMLQTSFSNVLEFNESSHANEEPVSQAKTIFLRGNVQDGFLVEALKAGKPTQKIQQILDQHAMLYRLENWQISPADYLEAVKPANVEMVFAQESSPRNRVILAYFFAGLMILVIFLSFAYQFTAITGEKQLKITEKVVSAVKPQVWMDGKIFGITLTGLASMATYAVISIIGGILYFQFIGVQAAGILSFLHGPSIMIFLLFSLMGILIWNAVMAAIASIITDPNNSGKSSLMMLPILFVMASFFVVNEPDERLAIFLSWFPLTAATAMPVRWAVSEVAITELAGSLVLMAASFYYVRKAAALIFNVSILISGKEPGWKEVFQMAREAAKT